MTSEKCVCDTSGKLTLCTCTSCCVCLHRDVGKDVQSVKHFTSELIVEAVVRCLRVIDPALGSGLSPSLPPGMSARFRVGMSLAQACQVRGRKG